jgi:hypothetical protein
MVAAMLLGDIAISKLLFGATEQIMALPEADREHIGQHLALMLERMEAGTARLAQSVAEEKAGIAAHTASRERTRAETAEAALSQTVTAMLVAEKVSLRLAEITGASQPSASTATSAAPPVPVVAAATSSPPTRSGSKSAIPKLSGLIDGFFKRRRETDEMTYAVISQERGTLKRFAATAR